MTGKTIKTAVIGAGASGLATTKCLMEPDSGFECTTFELSDSVGGTWVYTEDIEKDKYGLPVHSSMYRNLCTNLPKQIMSLPGLPFEGRSDASYVAAEEVLEYFNQYADHFNLRKHIKFQHYVNLITPLENGRWEISVTDLKQQKDFVDYFDAVIICVGNYSNPVVPRLRNREKFQGLQFHSHDYRYASCLENRKTLVIGAGPSALDVTFQGSEWAKKIYLSHHNKELANIKFPQNVMQKPDVRELTENSVIFEDGSEVEVDSIVYCTGYEPKYSFLHPSCGIRVEDGVVSPTYMHFVNIRHPTMFFVGIPRDCPGYTMFHLQARCCMQVLKGESKLPSKDEMSTAFCEELQQRLKSSGSMKGYHRLHGAAQPYFDSLTTLAQLPQTPRFVFDVYSSGLTNMLADFRNFRKRDYHIVDDERFTITARD